MGAGEVPLVKTRLAAAGLAAAALSVVALIASHRVADAHELHTTVLELGWNRDTSTMTGTVRLFADDLAAAARAAGTSREAYLLRGVRLRDARGDLPLSLCGERQIADALLLCLRTDSRDRVRLRDIARSGSGLRVRNTLLVERYADQMNIVRVLTARPVTLLLTKTVPERAVR